MRVLKSAIGRPLWVADSIAAARVELRGMVREGEQVPAKKLIEAKPCGIE
jgi:hypothetical protein